MRREESRTRCRESEKAIEREEEERERESLWGFFLSIYLCDVPASCDACRTPSAANLFSGRRVCTKGVERASAGGETEVEKEKRRKNGGAAAAARFAIATLGRPFNNSFSPCRRLRCGKRALRGPAQGLSDGRSPAPEGAREAKALPSGGPQRGKKRGRFRPRLFLGEKKKRKKF